MSYDAWLERPYQERAVAGDHFVDWCEDNGYDPDDPGAQDAYEDWAEVAAEDAAIARYEARMEAELFDKEDRGVW